jgi:transcriptional regulator with XRE-family HTH domain
MMRKGVTQNADMPTHEEKAEFAKRLKLALRRSPESIQGATDLALRFNLRYKGEAISPQTAHNWLAGRTIPRDDKLTTLANWLKVDEHWLHYGSPPAKNTSDSSEMADKKGMAKPAPETINLALKIQGLPAHWRYLVEEMVERVHQDLM